MPQNKKKIWQQPWQYKASFIIGFCILLIGFIGQYISSNPVTPPIYPYNILLLIGFIGYIFLLQHFFKHPIIKWLSSIPAAISSMVVYTFLVLLLGFIPQNSTNSLTLINSLGLHDIIHSWAYLLSAIFVLTTLGFTIIKKLKLWIKTKSNTLKNIAFFLNHFGLWLIIVSASLGAGQVMRIYTQSYLNIPTQKAENETNIFKLPFTIELKNFSIDYYMPKLAIVNPHSGAFLNEKTPLTDTTNTIQFNNWKIKTKKIIRNAHIINDSIVELKKPYSINAALIEAENKQGQSVIGWISNKGTLYTPKALALNQHTALVLLPPEPEKFQSIITLNNNHTDTVIVNKPIQYNGWKIYQQSYDEKKGAWSDYSLLELVYDPWLPVVYVGIYLLLGGSLLLFWVGKYRKN